jgi:hypothetical protein
MKHYIFFIVFFISSCAVPIKGKPFVDVKSGKPYSILKKADPQPNGFFILIDTIDGRRSMIDPVFRDQLYAAKETYVEAGKHTVLVDCRNGMIAGKYLQAELTFQFENSKTYIINCIPDDSKDSAKFVIFDEQGKTIEFSYMRHLE